MGTHVSVLMPAYNEAENLVETVPATGAVLEQMAVSWEILVIDDGSTDGTRGVMAELRSPNVRYIRLRRNAGKSAALSVGLDHVNGEVVVLIDADGQDDPKEIPRLLAELDSGLDLVTGRRAIRNDRFIKRNTSKLYNGVTAKVTGVPGKDFNSGLKAMRRELADTLEMYGELHRYIPVLAVWNGFKVGGDGRRAPRATPRHLEVRESPLLARLSRPGDGQVPHHLHGPAVPPVRWDRLRDRLRRVGAARVDGGVQGAWSQHRRAARSPTRGPAGRGGGADGVARPAG